MAILSRRFLRSFRFGSLTLAVSALLAGVSTRAVAQAPTGAGEYEIKAAYLLNFTRYVEWPPEAFTSAGDPIVLGVLGQNPFGPALARTMIGRTSQGRPVEVRVLDGVSDAEDCHAVYLAADEQRLHPDIVGQIARRGLLTIGEGEEFVRRGGILGFVASGQTVRFAANVKAADRAGLHLSSRMLALASNVYGRTGGP